MHLVNDAADDALMKVGLSEEPDQSAREGEGGCVNDIDH